ncbi:hypothetical protein [Rahnella laticis]|uniref:hypothetical protein n=1 Tax=Rahnella laticis TaxID=2787622 RepID=UPI0018A2A3D2|nr:hypothetical protein [Rahnella laticis]MBF7997513.1 hypothetical protein [Rahnella laticis]
MRLISKYLIFFPIIFFFASPSYALFRNCKWAAAYPEPGKVKSVSLGEDGNEAKNISIEYTNRGVTKNVSIQNTISTYDGYALFMALLTAQITQEDVSIARCADDGSDQAISVITGNRADH